LGHGVSLLELAGGIVLGGSIALLIFALVPGTGLVRNALFAVLPLSYISPIVLWLFSWLVVGWISPPPDFVYLWHKVIGVGSLVFFTFIQGLWGLRDL
jgi:hypothetical protein